MTSTTTDGRRDCERPCDSQTIYTPPADRTTRSDSTRAWQEVEWKENNFQKFSLLNYCC